LRIIALPSLDDLVYESNVPVLVKEADSETVKLVGRLALKAQEKVGASGLNFLVVSEGDEWAQRAFESYKKEVET